MNHPFKWWCCRYLLRVIFVRDNKDSRNKPNPAFIVHRCRDMKYRPERLNMTCEKEDCENCRQKHGRPRTVLHYLTEGM